MEVFTYDWLKGLCRKMREIAPIVPVCEWEGQRAIISGHDVDTSIRKAYDFYLLEKEMGIRSTFFILTTTPCYNILDPENRRKFEEMSQNGYEIGLHFDVSVYEDRSYESLQKEVCREARILTEVTGQPVRSVCLHSPGLAGIFPSFRGFINTSDFWNEIPILVDSCMDFNGIDPFEFIRKARNEPVALWLHPGNYGEKRPKYSETLVHDLCELISRMDSTLRINRTYRKQIGGSSLYEMIRGGNVKV